MAKRNHKQNKLVKEMINHLDNMLGEQDSGLLLCMVCNCLDKILEKTESNKIALRSIQLTINDYFSYRHDFEKGEQ